ncbi:SpoIIE family protein phosphatase [Saccharothrix violaceirubra]|nr:SpoIIE family protein phosphatase [Saccharothrix violaceirubra]
MGGNSDPEFDRWARRACDLVRTPAAMVSLIAGHELTLPGLCGVGEPWGSTRRASANRSAVAHQVTTGEPLIVADTTVDLRVRGDALAGSPRVGAYAGFPLTDAEGRVLGSLCVLDHVPRQWSGAELDLLDLLAESCSSVLRARIAAADAKCEQVRSTRAEAALQAALDRSQLLLTASQALSRAEDLAQIRATVTELVSGQLAPVYVGLTLPEGRADLHRIDDPRQAVGPESGAEVYDVGDDAPIASTARRGVLSLYPDPASIAAAFPPAAQRRYAEMGLHAIACAPLRYADDTTGVLLFGWDRPHEVDLVERTVITTLAGYVTHALERADFLQSRVSVARRLQEAMLTRVPEVNGMRLAACYVPAASDDQVGGDWYDVIVPGTQHPGDSAGVVLVVGDITGHDIDAATLMGQVRSMGRQAAWERPAGPPSAVVTALEQACVATGLAATGTMIQAHLLPLADSSREWVLTWANAGHPPPVVRHADGTTTILHGHDMLFGHPHLRDRPVLDHQVRLLPGDTVVFYTDGLIERRGSDIDEGITNLREVLAALRVTDDPRHLVDECVRRLLVPVGRHDDDVVLLAAHIPTGPDRPSRS